MLRVGPLLGRGGGGAFNQIILFEKKIILAPLFVKRSYSSFSCSDQHAYLVKSELSTHILLLGSKLASTTL